MKKLFAGLVATIMMVGLVSGLSGTSAVAGTRYPDSVPTGVKIRVPDTVQKGDTARIGVKVEGSGNANPQNGSVTIRVVRNEGGYRYVEVKDYDGGWVYFRTDRAQQGRQVLRARSLRPPGRQLAVAGQQQLRQLQGRPLTT